ncbi:hypothetical protein H0H92_006298 [Tricholoma furcatifolium]|nr:hypothetical protein H0H92_006298 [Tricholoma furcatifolium]
MEYISSPVVTLEAWIEDVKSKDDQYKRVDIAVAKVAEAIAWLRSCPLPPNASVGSVGGGRIIHPLWLDSEAPLLFTSTEALERYMDKALLKAYDFHRRQDLAPSIRLTQLPLEFCHSDVTYDNFLIDPKTLEISLIDADSISILPAPLFLEDGLGENPFSEAVWRQLGIPHSPEAELLDFVRGMLVRFGNPTFATMQSNPAIMEIPYREGYDNCIWPKVRNPV